MHLHRFPLCRPSPVVAAALAIMEGCIAAALLIGGGADALGAIQAVAVTVGLPFTFVMLVMCLSTFMGVRSEKLDDYRGSQALLAKTVEQVSD